MLEAGSMCFRDALPLAADFGAADFGLGRPNFLGHRVGAISARFPGVHPATTVRPGGLQPLNLRFIRDMLGGEPAGGLSGAHHGERARVEFWALLPACLPV